MVDPNMIDCTYVPKYTDEQIKECQKKIQFIEDRLIKLDSMDVEYRVMVDKILSDYKNWLFKMQNETVAIPNNYKIY